ncbi:MAG TPA: type II toxin-antitoxin system PemK/MazF family toxin [Tepidisphaeraceae bacterium]|jgi:mRNA interferase MazF|nr:type II toxin-antitoxin system PemK/MazF family toxin [Tepidisphaeraceae bacterium]
MSHRTYYPKRGDFIHFNASPSAGHEMAGLHFGLVMSPASYNRKTGMAIVLIAISKIKPSVHPRFGNTKEIPPGMINPTRATPSAAGLLFCDAVRQIDWRERNASNAGEAPKEFVEDALDRLLSAMEDDDNA